MKFSEALAAIKALDNGSELASAIEGEVEGLKSKNYEIIGEKRNASTKAATLESTVLAIAKLAGVEGDLESVLSTLEPKVRESLQAIATNATRITELETRATTAEGKLAAAERKSKLSEIATKAGANAAVLERLLGDKLDKLAVAEDGAVTLEGKALKEAIAADEGLSPFAAALFPQAQQNETKPAPKLPSGTPQGKPPAKDPVGATVSKMKFAVPGSKQ